MEGISDDVAAVGEAAEKNKTGRPVGYHTAKMPSILLDMRWAIKNVDSGRKGTSAREQWRKMLQEDRKGFLSLFSREEAAWRQTLADGKKSEREKVVKGEVTEEDAGSDKALDLIGEWLKEWDNGKG